jgi:hypothetical protein
MNFRRECNYTRELELETQEADSGAVSQTASFIEAADARYIPPDPWSW